jgi:anti-sigma regulatory factor (Ser/Thr protein kinase)/serine/threonine protein phosphatase PrpC
MRLSSIKIHWLPDVREAGDTAKHFANSLGFTSVHCEEICLVVTELASNLLRHASGGTIVLSRIEDDGRQGIQIESEDSGPGIPDVDQAMADGYSTVGGLGTGLGTVNRLMDDVEFINRQPAGLRVDCKRWVRPLEPGRLQSPLVFGAAARPFRQLAENGDAFLFKQWSGHALVGVIDGLGHGPQAQRASQMARQYVEQHFDQPLESIFRGTGRACRATRGVVMALAHFDLANHRLTVAGIGNIEVRLVGSPERFNLITRRGVLGMNAPNAVSTEHPWTSSSMLIMHSDGLKTHWDWKDFRDLEREAPSLIAQRLLEILGKTEDDATIIVAKHRC